MCSRRCVQIRRRCVIVYLVPERMKVTTSTLELGAGSSYDDDVESAEEDGFTARAAGMIGGGSRSASTDEDAGAAIMRDAESSSDAEVRVKIPPPIPAPFPRRNLWTVEEVDADEGSSPSAAFVEETVISRIFRPIFHVSLTHLSDVSPTYLVVYLMSDSVFCKVCREMCRR